MCSDILSNILSGIDCDILSGIYSEILPGILSGILFGIYSDILSSIYSGILFGIYSHILPGILFGICCDILSGIYSGILSGVLAAICLTLSVAWQAWVRVQAHSTASGAGDMVFGSRCGPERGRVKEWVSEAGEARSVVKI